MGELRTIRRTCSGVKGAGGRALARGGVDCPSAMAAAHDEGGYRTGRGSRRRECGELFRAQMSFSRFDG
jgi:hypothetical protein